MAKDWDRERWAHPSVRHVDNQVDGRVQEGLVNARNRADSDIGSTHICDKGNGRSSTSKSSERETPHGWGPPVAALPSWEMLWCSTPSPSVQVTGDQVGHRHTNCKGQRSHLEPLCLCPMVPTQAGERRRQGSHLCVGAPRRRSSGRLESSMSSVTACHCPECCCW